MYTVGVSDYYAGKTIFITGATGFVGKVLIEKLLRCCPEIKMIYLLIRPKKGHGTKERLNDFISGRIFENLRLASSKVFDKLQMISGDIVQENLGISIADWVRLQEECQIVFHCAACVRFDMFIRDAININTLGTMKALKLAEGMQKLEVFVLVSTAFCQCDLPLLEERVYPCKHKPQNVMDCVEWMDDELLAHIQSKLIASQPNTYAYTKSLSEDLVSQYADKLPIVIARPSIVTASYKEPMPGWVDNLNGPTGIIVGAGKGVIRTMLCSSIYEADLIPVDMAVNGCILLAYVTGIEKPKEIRVCNITQSGLNPITWERAIELGRAIVHDIPFSVCLWYPRGSPTTSRLKHSIEAFFTHLLPAYFIDLLLFLLGKKTFMVQIQRRVKYGIEVLHYYATKKWIFKNEYFLSLQNKISKQDNEVFYTDMGVLNWNEYITDYVKGAREYCCKEDPANLPQARRLHKQLYYMDIVTKLIICLLCAYFIYYYIIRVFIL